MMENSMMNSMFGFGLGGSILMLVYWGAIIIFIFWIIRELSGKNKQSQSSSALDILKERYAKGEINKEEFEIKKKDLTN